MICPNCHGDIEDNLVTCPMCGYILDYKKLDINSDLDKKSRFSFLVTYNICFIAKLLALVAVIILVLYGLYIYFPEGDIDYLNVGIVLTVLIVCIIFIVLLFKNKRKW